MIDEVRKHCGTRIEYTGDEKEMESQQGRERNSRQREVAIVIKESQVSEGEGEMGGGRMEMIILNEGTRSE